MAKNLIVVSIYADTNRSTAHKRSRERDMSETESHAMDSEDDASSTYESESPITTDDETETEGEEKDPWMPMVDEAMQQDETAFEEMKNNLIDSGLDEQSAREKAYSNIFPQLQKELEGIYMERLLWMNQLKKDPVHKKIMQTKEAFVGNDDFYPEEAIEAAIDKRKFLIKRILKNYNFDEENDNKNE